MAKKIAYCKSYMKIQAIGEVGTAQKKYAYGGQRM